MSPMRSRRCTLEVLPPSISLDTHHQPRLYKVLPAFTNRGSTRCSRPSSTVAPQGAPGLPSTAALQGEDTTAVLLHLPGQEELLRLPSPTVPPDKGGTGLRHSSRPPWPPTLLEQASETVPPDKGDTPRCSSASDTLATDSTRTVAAPPSLFDSTPVLAAPPTPTAPLVCFVCGTSRAHAHTPHTHRTHTAHTPHTHRTHAAHTPHTY